MKVKHILLVMAAIALTLPLVGCSGDNKVEQGRVVGVEKNAEGKVIKIDLIHDSAMDPQNPVYDVLPPATFNMPKDPAETGPEPQAGQRMKLDVDKKEIIIYDLESKKLETIPIDITDLQDSVDSRHKVLENKTFPIIDLDKKSITIYSPRQKMLCTFTPPEMYLDQNRYQPSTWLAGDEVRLTYKDADRYQALRFMNISKTDIYKR